MKQRLTLVSCLGGMLLPVTPALAEDDTDIIFAEDSTEITPSFTTAMRDDVDFDTSTQTLGIKAVTPYGLVMCDYGSESGETRIDTFDDIFGTQSVLTTRWNSYDASLLQCGYGIKLPLSGGELSGGIGLMHYNGETDSMLDGKKIDVDAFRLQARYVHGDYDTRVQFVDQSYNYLYHYLTGGYQSTTAGTIRTLNLEVDWGPLYAEAQHVHGDKDKDFIAPPLPLPSAYFDYEQVTVSLGPTLDGSLGPLRYIAPTYIRGSERGSFSRLTLDNGFHGIIAGLAFDGSQLHIRYQGMQSAGSRDYSPVTSDLAEAMKSSSLSVELEADEWSITLENNRLLHDGYIAVTSAPIPYTLLSGCPVASCRYNNVRRENEWKFHWNYSYSDNIELQGALYQRLRKDTQYEYAERKYHETGGDLGVAITF